MRRTLGALVAAVAVLLTFAPAVLADEQYYGCSEATWINDTSKFVLYEHAIGDVGDGNDQLLGCNDLRNLHNITHVPAGGCRGYGIVVPNNWGDCVSSIYVKIPGGQVFCWFEDPDYWGAHKSKVGPYAGRFNLTVGFADQISSVAFTPGVSDNNCLDL
jgi:hypothetical protein